MSQLLIDNPWLLLSVPIAVVIVASLAICIIPEHLRQSRQAEIDASLKHDMVNRGMSAADIKTVLRTIEDQYIYISPEIEPRRGMYLGLVHTPSCCSRSYRVATPDYNISS